MKKSLTINATRAGKKVSKNIGYVNPDVANSLVGGFAQMVNALTTDTFVNAEVVKKMDTTEEEQSGGGGSGKQIPTLAFTNADTVFPSESAADMGYKPTVTAQISYDGDGTIYTTQPDYLHSLASGDQITWTASGSRAAYVLYAKETNNYAAAVLIY